MNVVDSSGRLGYFADGPKAVFFAAATEKPAALVVAPISLNKVFKQVLQQRDLGAALQTPRAEQIVSIPRPLERLPGLSNESRDPTGTPREIAIALEAARLRVAYSSVMVRRPWPRISVQRFDPL